MDITFERPSHRLHHRLNAPLQITIDDIKLNSVNWSLGGFSVPLKSNDKHKIGDKTNCSITLPFQGFQIAFVSEAKIVRVDVANARLAAQFTNLDKRQRDILKYFTEELVRGSMTSVNDTIIRIDSPVTPVSTEPDASPASEVPLSRWTFKNIFKASSYLLSGMALVSYFLITLYYNFFVLEISSGVIFTRTERIVSTTSGKIKALHIQPGDLLTQGQPLVTIDDPVIEEKIALAELKVARKESMLESQRNRMQVESNKMSDFANFAVLELEQTKKDISSHKIMVQLANSEVKRLKRLQEKNMASSVEVDRAIGKLTLAYSKLQKANVDLQHKEEVLAEVDRGYYFTGQNLIGSVNEFKIEIIRLANEVTISQKELDVLLDHKARLDISSPGEGRVVELFNRQGGSIKQGDLIALFEHNQRRVVHAYLTQDEVLSIKKGTSAKVYFPATGESIQAEVVYIDRTGGISEESSANFEWVDKDRTVLVKLHIKDIDDDKIRETLPHGLPAMIIFKDIEKGLIGKAIRSYLLQSE